MAIKRGEVYKVRKIKQKRMSEDRAWEYLCEWVGYDDETWESAETLRDGANHMLNAFNEKWSKNNNGRPASKRARLK